MKLLERLSANIFKRISMPYVKAFDVKSPETILKRSVNVLETETVENIRAFVRAAQTSTGGFADKAGKPDLYYTLFGSYLTDALDLEMLNPSLMTYVEAEISRHHPTGIHLNCAAILLAKPGTDASLEIRLREKVKENIDASRDKQPVYGAFIDMLTCYYLQDYRGLYRIRRQLHAFHRSVSLPCSVLAALLVLQRSFHNPVEDLISDVLSFYDGKGGFRANRSAPVADMLSTAVALYALHFAGADLRKIKPDCLVFTDHLYRDGGFAANVLDPDTDIEYTFYGLLALGSLAESNE